MKGDQSRLDRRYQHIDLSPREMPAWRRASILVGHLLVVCQDAAEARYRQALARIEAARRSRSQVDGWAQRPGCGGLADYAPLADELPDYREARKVRVPPDVRSVWTKRKDRP